MIELRRRVMVFGESLIYDSQIEYLQSNGNQYIDTGITGGTNAEYEIKMQVTESQSNYSTFFGSTKNENSSNANVPKAYFNSKRIQIQFGTGVSINMTTTNDVYDVHTIEFKNGKLYTDGVEKASPGQYGFGSNNFWLFAYPAESWRKSKMKLFYAKIWRNGTLVRDFIPVRVGTEGYLYDKVSGTLFGNSTDGFILGPDI